MQRRSAWHLILTVHATSMHAAERTFLKYYPDDNVSGPRPKRRGWF